jgi:hypothetical protein
MNKHIIEILVMFALLFFIFSSADAEQKYFWTDENGQLRVSDTEPDNWDTQNYEETMESKQGEVQRAQEEAIQQTQKKQAAESKSKGTTTRKKG